MRTKGLNGRFECPCCGYAALDEHGRFEICEICFWEDDGQDDRHSEENWGGPNKVSLDQARMNFLIFGAAEEKDIEYVRSPRHSEEIVVKYRIVNDQVCAEPGT